MLKRLSDYQVITGLSVLGIAAIAYLSGSKASGDFAIWRSVEMDKSEIRLSGELEKTKAEVSREIADAYRKNQIGRFNQIEITDYVYSSTPPNLDWNQNVDPNTLTIVLDQYRRCVGVAHKGTYIHAYKDPQVCQDF
ncbi:MAG TPA: hypothetical protein DCP31_28695 [Cyanobacteria bacterium UBA8543]|nr:hypothetical protein [Cyanobacteria bacterium UBA8543]